MEVFSIAIRIRPEINCIGTPLWSSISLKQLEHAMAA